MSRGLVDKVVRLCESRGFSVESRIESSLGTTHAYQFGPLGTELRRNLRNAWWHDVVRSKGNVYGFESISDLITHVPETFIRRNSESAASLTEEGKKKEHVSDPLNSKYSITVEFFQDREKTSILTQLLRKIPGIEVPFGIAWNRKYFNKPENDHYILRYFIISVNN